MFEYDIYSLRIYSIMELDQKCRNKVSLSFTVFCCPSFDCKIYGEMLSVKIFTSLGNLKLYSSIHLVYSSTSTMQRLEISTLLKLEISSF